MLRFIQLIILEIWTQAPAIHSLQVIQSFLKHKPNLPEIQSLAEAIINLQEVQVALRKPQFQQFKIHQVQKLFIKSIAQAFNHLILLNNSKIIQSIIQIIKIKVKTIIQ